MKENKLKKISRLKLILYVIMPIILLFAFSLKYSIRINVSGSLPYKVFILDKGNKQAEIGKIMAFIAPNNGYYKGDFAKYVMGIPGDEVKYEGDDVFVGNLYIGKVKIKSKEGDLLSKGPSGIIPKGHYFMASDHKDSFDSRYKNIGYVKDSNIIGTIYPIF
ncbi:MAG: S26 family signal peptidase [Proteobacteria bacterium]|nr:S26 family signal peptidase [Pseudomonadota bacterium]